MTRIYLLSTIGNDLKLLEPWLAYYQEFQFDQILISLQVGDGDDPSTLALCNTLAESHGARIGELHRSSRYDQRLRIARLKERYCRPGDWIALADVDEFVEYTEPPRDLVRRCLAGKFDYVTARFLDRFGAGGTLPELRTPETRELWDLFPMGCHFTRDIAQATDTKVVLAAATSDIRTGQHTATGVGMPEELGGGLVHHFKWDSSVHERSSFMLWLNAMNEDPWVVENLRVLRYLEQHHGLDLVQPPTSVYWPRYRRRSPHRRPSDDQRPLAIDMPFLNPRCLRAPSSARLEACSRILAGMETGAPLVQRIYANIAEHDTVSSLTGRVLDLHYPPGTARLEAEAVIQQLLLAMAADGCIALT